MVELGSEVQDTVTGFRGVAVARTEFLNGCFRISVQPTMDKDGKIPDAETIDEPQLKVLKEGKVDAAPYKGASFDLGEEVKDQVTGFKGIAVGRTEFLNGIARIAVQPKVSKDGKVKEVESFNENNLEVIGKKKIPQGSKKTGGPLSFRPTQQRVPRE